MSPEIPNTVSSEQLNDLLSRHLPSPVFSQDHIAELSMLIAALLNRSKGDQVTIGHLVLAAFTLLNNARLMSQIAAGRAIAECRSLEERMAAGKIMGVTADLRTVTSQALDLSQQLAKYQQAESTDECSDAFLESVHLTREELKSYMRSLSDDD